MQLVQNVRKVIPVEQGLRLRSSKLFDIGKPVRKVIPVEQGLRQRKTLRYVSKDGVVRKVIPVEQGLKNSLHNR